MRGSRRTCVARGEVGGGGKSWDQIQKEGAVGLKSCVVAVQDFELLLFVSASSHLPIKFIS